MTIKTQAIATALLTLTLLVAALWANGIIPVASTAAVCLDGAHAASPVERHFSAPASAPMACSEPQDR